MSRAKYDRPPRYERHARLYVSVTRSAEYRRLSPRAKELLVLMLAKLNGGNNGTLIFSTKDYCVFGTKQTFLRYRNELLNAGFVVVTQDGGKALGRRCTLYAITTEPLNMPKGFVYPPGWHPGDKLDLWRDAHAARRVKYREAGKRPNRHAMRREWDEAGRPVRAEQQATATCRTATVQKDGGLVEGGGLVKVRVSLVRLPRRRAAKQVPH